MDFSYDGQKNRNRKRYNRKRQDKLKVERSKNKMYYDGKNKEKKRGKRTW